MFKNDITIEQLELACRHVEEMKNAGVTENLAIRTLELFADIYANIQQNEIRSVHHVDHVKLWSRKAKNIRRAIPDGKPKDSFIVEHGTPRRAFAREVFALYEKKKLNTRAMTILIQKKYKLAVITLDENKVLNKIARCEAYTTPEERWDAAGIKF